MLPTYYPSGMEINESHEFHRRGLSAFVASQQWFCFCCVEGNTELTVIESYYYRTFYYYGAFDIN